MDIDIYCRGIDFKIHEIVGLDIGAQQPLVTFENGLMEHRMAHIAAVDGQILERIAAPRIFGKPDKSAEFDKRCRGLDGNELLVEILSEEIGDAAQFCGTAQRKDCHVVMDKREVYPRIDQRQALELAGYGSHLNGILFQELTAGRHVIEQVLDLHIRSGSRALGLLALYFGAIDDEPRADGGIFGFCAHFDAGNRAYRGKRLAAESHCGQSEQIVGSRNFARGVAFECHARIGIAHAAAVVNNLNKSPSGVFDNDGYRRRSGVDSVFDQLFHHRRRSLNDLAGGYLVGN